MNTEVYVFLRSHIKVMEGLSALVGFIYWYKIKNTYWRWLPIYLTIICCCEFISAYANSNKLFDTKFIYSYIVIPLEFTTPLLLFLWLLPKSFSKIILILILLFWVAFIVEFLLRINVKWYWSSFSFSIGSITVIIASIIYFLHLISTEKIIHFKWNLGFWYTLAIIIFYAGAFPHFSTINYLYKVNSELSFKLSWLMILFNYVMYSFFILGFICHKQKL